MVEDEITEIDQCCCRNHLKEVEEEVVEVIWEVAEVMEVCLEVQWEVTWVIWEEVPVHGQIRAPWAEVLVEVIAEAETLAEVTTRDQVTVVTEDVEEVWGVAEEAAELCV